MLNIVMKKSGSGDKKGTKDATDGPPVKKDSGADPVRPGYPQAPSQTGGAPSQTGEGRTIHNGSAGAFDATEQSHEGEDDDQDSDDFAMDS